MKTRAIVSVLLAGALRAATLAAEDRAPVVEVFRPAHCEACNRWIEHLRQNGFEVQARDAPDMAGMRRRLGVPDALESTHTSRVSGYVIEGYVPAEDIRLLLKERPKALGLAVPGMPMGAPGRESGRRRELFDTLLILPGGQTRVYARH